MISISNPCGKHWGEMPGDERRKFCADCGKDLFSAAAFPEAELAGRCVYLGGETAMAPQSRRVVLAGALLTTISQLLAQDGRARVTVTDASGAAVSGSEVMVGEQKAKSDAAGVAVFTGLPSGRLPVRVATMGFKIWIGALNVTNGGEANLEARIEVGTVGGGAAIVALDGALLVNVLDPTGAAVAKGDVAAVCAGDVSRKATIRAGQAVFSSVPTGECRVRVTVAGFKPWEATATVREGASITLSANLELAPVSDKVAVKPSGPLSKFKNWLTSCTRR